MCLRSACIELLHALTFLLITDDSLSTPCSSVSTIPANIVAFQGTRYGFLGCLWCVPTHLLRSLPCHLSQPRHLLIPLLRSLLIPPQVSRSRRWHTHSTANNRRTNRPSILVRIHGSVSRLGLPRPRFPWFAYSAYEPGTRRGTCESGRGPVWEAKAFHTLGSRRSRARRHGIRSNWDEATADVCLS